MTDIRTKHDEDALSFEVPDEALEIAGAATGGQVSFTLGACTGLSECPG